MTVTLCSFKVACGVVFVFNRNICTLVSIQMTLIHLCDMAGHFAPATGVDDRPEKGPMGSSRRIS